MPQQFDGYDDDLITLGAGILAVDQSPDGVALVRGSRQHARDPRLTDAEAERHYRRACRPRPGEKWRPTCGETRQKDEFSPNKRSFDGLYYQCKECEAKRKVYRVQVGRSVRQYTRRALVPSQYKRN